MSAISCISPSSEEEPTQRVESRGSDNYERCEAGAWEGNSPPSQGPIPPESVPYYYEDISRETADLVLWDRGCVDGMYLLRKSTNKDADYVLSLCYNNRSVGGFKLFTFLIAGLPRWRF